MTNNPNSMEINVSSAISVNEDDVSAGGPVRDTPLGIEGAGDASRDDDDDGDDDYADALPGNNTFEKTAIDMALRNESGIKKLGDELKTIFTILNNMRGDYERSIGTNQTGLLAVYGALYGKQLDDIKHGYNLELEENTVIKNGIAYAADIKAQMREPKYKNALMKHLNEVGTQNQGQVAAPALAADARTDVQPVDTAAERAATTTAASAGTNVAPASSVAAVVAPADDVVADEPRQATTAVGWDEHNIDVMAENRWSNIIIKGIPEGSRVDDRMEVEEMLGFLFCSHRINQIKDGGIVRLGGRRGSRNRFLMVSFTTEAVANQVYERRHMLDKHPYMDSVYIMKDLPRSERANRRASNTINEAANSGGNGTQNLRGGNGSTGSIENRATMTGNQSNTNNNNVERVERLFEGIDGVEERDNEVWTDASSGEASEPRVHTAEATIEIEGNEGSEQQPADGDRGEIGNMEGTENEEENESSEQQSAGGDREARANRRRANISGNEGVGGIERGS